MTKARIGILTIGGDCSGLNSVIRGAYKRATILGYELIGVKRGLSGLAKAEPEYIVLTDEICDDSLLSESGSILYSDTKSLRLMVASGKSIEDIKKDIVAGYKALGLQGLIYVGGDGSLSLLNEILSDNDDLNFVAVPKTIDNDIAATEFAIGFKTAVSVVVEAIENIKSTAKSHERVMVVEVMGRDAGFIAMNAGLASGADVILVPEFEYTFEGVTKKIHECYASGKNHCIIVVSEAVDAPEFKHDQIVVDGIKTHQKTKYNGIGGYIEKELASEGFDVRSVVLGHVQRGGKTSIEDRIVGSGFGAQAVNLVDKGDCGRLLCYLAGDIKSVLIKDAIITTKKRLEKTDFCVDIAINLGIYIGEF